MRLQLRPYGGEDSSGHPSCALDRPGLILRGPCCVGNGTQF